MYGHAHVRISLSAALGEVGCSPRLDVYQPEKKKGVPTAEPNSARLATPNGEKRPASAAEPQV